MIELRIDSGIETAMITVLRQLPRNTRIISAVRQAAMSASRSTPEIEARTNTDWSASGLISSSGGRLAAICGSASLTLLMMSSVEALPTLLNREQRGPLAVHADDVGLRREAVADVRDVVDVDRVGRRPSGSAGRSAPRSSSGSRSGRRRTRSTPIFCVPPGRIRFWTLMAFTTSAGVRCLACSDSGSRSTWICGCLPPYGYGIWRALHASPAASGGS